MLDETIISALDSLLTKDYRSKEHHAKPGAAVLIAVDNQIVYQRCTGHANIADSQTITCDTNFRLASISKQFIAHGIILLERQSKLSRQSTLACFFSSEFKQQCPNLCNTVRVQHLLDHSSGIMDYETHDPLPNKRQWSDQDVLTSLEDKTYFTPGSQYRYSNTGYILLGLIIEIASGRNLNDFLRKFIFDPCEMKTSLMFDSSDNHIVNRAYGYALNENDQNYILSDQSPTSATRGDGGVYMSVSDYFQWYRHFQPETIDPFPIQNKSKSSPKYYSLGWFLSDVQGSIRIHTGHSCGFTHQVFRIDEKQCRVLILYLSNILANDEHLRQFNQLIFDRITQLNPNDIDLLRNIAELTR